VLLLPFALPWIMILPSSWIGPYVGFASILCNAVILYLLFGGLRIRKCDKWRTR
jgi:hypothetical protein